ncbi:peptidoglycan DD-metalloendopeptidase family protein [Leisingera sp. HS039]|uniref:peptidoglycan DD-metalloendopeptidase family protein n=2 Tax=Leisingera TaxID=191028 RepID=UPI001B3A599B|nr:MULTISPECIES: peptidoglycan DD-metalloendopeptidase family protein [unclassified Leisingera]MBQ4823702.1 peptidoglycan DD-metalloendopeptidase family protein [Leisingera sp. HS039]MCF6430060.1 peptidoglycan DD-metalloendopeptidase family protein [Leisingera sp. MMG026]
MTRTPPNRTAFRGLPRARLLAALPLAGMLTGVLAACQGPLDYDLRGQLGAFNTAGAAQSATANRPSPDARGLISYPSYQVAVAQRGDTVSDVAARIGLPPAEVARFNGMETGDKMRQGEVLALPRRAPDSLPGSATAGSVDIATLAGQAIDTAPLTSPNPGSVTPTAIQPVPKPQPPKVQAGPEPVRHKVKRGETAYTISRLYQVPVKSLAEWNGLGSDFAVREGQFLLIPLKEEPAPRPAPAAAAVAVTEPGAGSETPVPPSASQPLPEEKVEPAAVKPAAETLPKPELPKPTRASSAAMAYPVQGKIVKTYSKGRNDGIDIAAAAGAPVNAAEAGTVAAITKDSNNVPIVVIRHSQKLLTVYQNVGNITVKKGESVVRGQRIASLRGGDDAYVHFEVRDGFESIDPLSYLN